MLQGWEEGSKLGTNAPVAAAEWRRLSQSAQGAEKPPRSDGQSGPGRAQSRRVLTYIRPPSSSKAQLSSVTFYYPRNFHPFLVVYPCTMADLKKLNVLMCELIPALPPSVSTGKSPKLTASDAIEQVVQYVSTRVR